MVFNNLNQLKETVKEMVDHKVIYKLRFYKKT
jgi:hypothetical protein